jgi:hypothetical protein
MLLAGFVAGLFATGGQSVLYALAPLFIPRRSAPPGSAPPWRWAVSGR